MQTHIYIYIYLHAHIFTYLPPPITPTIPSPGFSPFVLAAYLLLQLIPTGIRVYALAGWGKHGQEGRDPGQEEGQGKCLVLGGWCLVGGWVAAHTPPTNKQTTTPSLKQHTHTHTHHHHHFPSPTNTNNPPKQNTQNSSCRPHLPRGRARGAGPLHHGPAPRGRWDGG